MGEESLERKDFDCTIKIQRAWKKWKFRKLSIEQRKIGADILRGKKERKRDSVQRKFEADYMGYEENFPLQEAILRSTEDQYEEFVFADSIIKFNRRSNTEKRDLVITNKAFYFVMRKKVSGQLIYKVTRRTLFNNMADIQLSP